MAHPLPDQLRPADPWRKSSPRVARRAGIWALWVVAGIVAGLWGAPSLLNWGRFRGTLAALAGAELGRPVIIDGDVALRLVPETVLTANDVVLSDRGDGITARIASLRLELSPLKLLSGRIVPHDLVLDSPVVTLPWPLPLDLANPVRPRLPHPFAAHVENGRLLIGQAIITGITAAIHGGPAETPGTPEDHPVAAFGAEGFAAFDGHDWRFATALGAPDADGVSAVDLTLQGQGSAAGTRAAIEGTLAEGALAGRLRAGGPDLSVLMPAPAEPWDAALPFVATGKLIVSPALSLALGHAPATGTLALRLAPPARLDGRLDATAVDLDRWQALLAGGKFRSAMPAIPVRLTLAASNATLLGGTLSEAGGILAFADGATRVAGMHAILPGGAQLTLGGALSRGKDGTLGVTGPARLDAPDLRATLAWLRPAAPTLIDALPPSVLTRATLAGDIVFTPGALTASHLAGSLDGAAVSGALGLRGGARPAIAADLRLAMVDLDAWLAGGIGRLGGSLADFARPLAGLDTHLILAADRARLHGETLEGLALTASTDAAGLRIDRLAARWDGIAFAAAGGLTADGRLQNARVHAAIADPALTLAQWPPAFGVGPWGMGPWGVRSWPVFAGLWQRDTALALSADGPPEAVALRLQATSGDLLLEAEGTRDTGTGAGRTTLTLRHPGAPRLLAALGVADAHRWLATGAVALRADVRDAPGRLSVRDFALTAAALRLEGEAEIAYAGAAPRFDISLLAEGLPLPASGLSLAPLTDLTLPPRWQGHIGLTAAAVTAGLRPLAENAGFAARFAGGDLAIDGAARVGGGRFTLQAAVDGASAPPRLAVRADLADAAFAGPLTGLPLDADGGAASATLALDSVGATPAALAANLTGQVRATLGALRLTGFDLPLLADLAAPGAHPSRAALVSALSSGASPQLSGTIEGKIAKGRVSLSGGPLASADGTVGVAGTIGVPSGDLDLHVDIVPAGATRHFGRHLTGPWTEAKAVPDPGPPSAAAKRKPHR